MSGLCINRYRPIIGRLLDADYRSADNRPLPYRCISTFHCRFRIESRILTSNYPYTTSHVRGSPWSLIRFSFSYTVIFAHSIVSVASQKYTPIGLCFNKYSIIHVLSAWQSVPNQTTPH